MIEETLDLEGLGFVQGHKTPKKFNFNRCAKQGGMESPWEWNMVMRHVLNLCVDRWVSSGYGIDLPVLGKVTNVVWADNIYFLSAYPLEAQRMAQDFTDIMVHQFGLRWKPESLEFLTTSRGSASPLSLRQDGGQLDVKHVQEMHVLGSVLWNTGSVLPAVRHRLGRAAACFWKLQSYLCEPSLSLTKRMEEFSCRVHAAALYASGAWTWSRSLYNELYRWENSFLRRITSFRRQPGEDFVHHITRATRRSRQVFHQTGNLSLASKVLDSLHRIAGTSFARLSCETTLKDGNEHDVVQYNEIVDTVISPSLLVFMPSQCFLPACILFCDHQWWTCRQAVGTAVDPTQLDMQWRHKQPGLRLGWETVFLKVLGGSWKNRAADCTWQQRRGEFRDGAYKYLNMKPLEVRFCPQRKARTGSPPSENRKRAREVSWIPQDWGDNGRRRLEIVGDSMLIISWINGTWKCRYRIYDARVNLMHTLLERGACSHNLRPRHRTADWARHIFRELNGYADVLANRHSYTSWFNGAPPEHSRFRLFFDGSVTNVAAGGGWALYGTNSAAYDVEDEWYLIAELSFPMPRHSTITVCELEACVWGVAFFTALLESVDAALDCLAQWTPLNTRAHLVLQFAQLIS